MLKQTNKQTNKQTKPNRTPNYSLQNCPEGLPVGNSHSLLIDGAEGRSDGRELVDPGHQHSVRLAHHDGIACLLETTSSHYSNTTTGNHTTQHHITLTQ